MTKYAAKNLQVAKRMERQYKMAWKEIWQKVNWSSVISYYRLLGGGCSKCGGGITAMILKFYGFDAEKALCYKCQKQSPRKAGVATRGRM